MSPDTLPRKLAEPERLPRFCLLSGPAVTPPARARPGCGAMTSPAPQRGPAPPSPGQVLPQPRASEAEGGPRPGGQLRPRRDWWEAAAETAHRFPTGTQQKQVCPFLHLTPRPPLSSPPLQVPETGRSRPRSSPRLPTAEPSARGLPRPPPAHAHNQPRLPRTLRRCGAHAHAL